MYEMLSQRMLQALISGGFAELAQTASDCLGLPVMVTDAEYNCLAHIPNESIGDPLWDAIHENGSAPISFIRLFNDENMMKTGMKQREPYLLNWGFLSDHPRILGNIFVGDTIAGYLAIPSPAVTDDLMAAVKLICSVLSVEFQRHSVPSGIMPDAWSMFLSSLIDGKIHNQTQLEQWQIQLGKKITGGFCIIAARPANDNAEKRLLPFIQRDILQREPELYPITSGDAIYFLITDCPDRKACDKKINYILSSLSFLNLRYGISNRFSDVMQIEIYRDQASFALYSCLQGGTDFLHYSDCILQKIFGDILDHIPVQSCVHPAVQILEQHDKTNGTEYGATLSAYILSMCNTAATVAKLHIHRNTLPHRLNAIERIAEIDLSNTATCAHLLCSYYILQISAEKHMD